MWRRFLDGNWVWLEFFMVISPSWLAIPKRWRIVGAVAPSWVREVKQASKGDRKE